MKCTFDGHTKNHDIVCMSLCKRQFPPFGPSAFFKNLSTYKLYICMYFNIQYNHIHQYYIYIQFLIKMSMVSCALEFMKTLVNLLILSTS